MAGGGRVGLFAGDVATGGSFLDFAGGVVVGGFAVRVDLGTTTGGELVNFLFFWQKRQRRLDQLDCGPCP